MKWLFFALLLVNVWYFWTHSGTPDAAPPPALAPRVDSNAVNQLLMLSELKAGELRTRGAGDERGPQPVARSQGTPAAAAPAGGAAAGARGELIAQPAEPDATCLMFGPLTGEAPGRDIRQWASEQGGWAKLHERERREVSRYWVFFPPESQRSAAVARVEQMQTRNIDDIYIITRGDMANAISLGVYSRKDSLERRLAQLRAKGYEPSVAPRYKTEVATWLDAVFPAGFVLDTGALAGAFGQVEVSDIPCTPEARAQLEELGTPGKTNDDNGDSSTQPAG